MSILVHNDHQLASMRTNSRACPASDDRPFEEFLSTLQVLIREPSVVGMEDSFFRALRRELEEVGVNVVHYHGLLVAQGNDPHHVILSAHIDRHGLLCTGPNEFQYAAFIVSNQSELTGDSVSEQMLHTIAGRFRGQRVQAHLPYAGTYIGQGTIDQSYVCPQRNNLIFEINGLDFLQPGTPISFLDRLRIRDDYISAQLDNVLSVAMIVHLFRHGFQGTALFTAQEEAGRSWRYAHSWFQHQRLLTQRLLVLDTSPYPTREAADAQQVVLRRRDANAVFADRFTEEIAERCRQLNIAVSFKDSYIAEQNRNRTAPLSYGRTELGRLAAATQGAINGTTLQIPTTGYHTPDETASLASLRAALQLLGTFIR